MPISAVCVASARDTEVVGLTRQLVGQPEVHAPPFAWCGTITPVDLPSVAREIIRQIAQVLARGTGLCGLFGCDFLVDVSKIKTSILGKALDPNTLCEVERTGNSRYHLIVEHTSSTADGSDNPDDTSGPGDNKDTPDENCPSAK